MIIIINVTKAIYFVTPASVNKITITININRITRVNKVFPIAINILFNLV